MLNNYQPTYDELTYRDKCIQTIAENAAQLIINGYSPERAVHDVIEKYFNDQNLTIEKPEYQSAQRAELCKDNHLTALIQDKVDSYFGLSYSRLNYRVLS